MTSLLRATAIALALAAGFAAYPAAAQQNGTYAQPGGTYAQPGGTYAQPGDAYGSPAPAAGQNEAYTSEELIREGHSFFGGVSEGLASVVERAVSDYGLPNGYILGQEGSGALIAGLRYGEGTLYTRNAGQHKVYWQGPTIGPDVGGSGDRVMMLVYNLPSVDAVYQRFLGISGSAHVIAGFGMTALGPNGIYRGSHHLRRRRPPRRQFRLPQDHRPADLEPFLIQRFCQPCPAFLPVRQTL